MLRVPTWIVAAFAAYSCCALAAGPKIGISRGSPQYVPLSIGESGTLVVLMRNDEPATLDSVAIEITTFLSFESFAYPVAMNAQPVCGTLIPETYFPGRYLFYIGPIASQQTIKCVFEVTRSPTSTDSTPMSFNVYDFPVIGPNPNHDGVSFYLGTFTDVAMSSQQLAFSLDQGGIAHSVLRVRAENRGEANVGAIRVTACTDNFSPDFYIESDFPGGCGPDVGAFCFDSGFGFQLPPLAAGRGESCDLKLTSIKPYTGRLDFEFMRIEGSMLPDPVTGGTLIDTNEEDDWFDLYQAAPPPQPVPAEWPITHLIVALGIIVLGSRALQGNPPA
ncbi:MAG TPA: hypothetical protein VFE67_19155 [Rudaea sp.]|nr:hypothetical protein [Rudaea sp.]